MITSVYFGNQATREQLEGRLNENQQLGSEIMIITIHCGILTEIRKKYEHVRSLSLAVKDFADLINE